MEVKIGRQIAVGGMGAIYEAEIIGSSSPFVAKRIDGNADATFRARFRREVRMQMLLKHRHIMPVRVAALDGEFPFFVMPRALANLRDRLTAGFVGEATTPTFREIAEGIAHAHANNVIHRDIKPDNVLFLEDGGKEYAVISDFGLGRFIDRDTTTLTSTNVQMGTFAYMAPEQFRDTASVDSRADVYSLGKVLYEMLTGAFPFPNISIDAVPSKFRYIVEKACQDAAADRYQSVQAMVNDIDRVTKKVEELSRPEVLFKLAIEGITQSGDLEDNALETICTILLDNLEDESFLLSTFPEIPDPILKALLQRAPTEFMSTLRAYDQAASGGLPWEYCDVVATLYRKLFNWTESREIRKLILGRLLPLAEMHNRYFVGSVFARLVANTTDHNLLLFIRDLLTRSPKLTAWIAPYMREHSLPAELRKLLP